MIERTDSQSTTLNAVVTVDGERLQAATANSTIRPGRGFHLSVELNVPAGRLDEGTIREIAGLFAGYVRDEIGKAAALGIPVTLQET